MCFDPFLFSLLSFYLNQPPHPMAKLKPTISAMGNQPHVFY